MAMANAMAAFQRQAAAWIASTNAALEAAGHGFDDDDRAAIAASAAAHPLPDGYTAGEPSAADIDAAQEMTKRALAAVYPPEGFAADDPRLAPAEGVTLALLAIGAKAIGWSTDEGHIDRVVAALGVDRAVWERAAAELRRRVADDIVLGAFYGQLYAQA